MAFRYFVESKLGPDYFGLQSWEVIDTQENEPNDYKVHSQGEDVWCMVCCNSRGVSDTQCPHARAVRRQKKKEQ